MRRLIVWGLLVWLLLLPQTASAQAAPLTNPSSLNLVFAQGYNDILETGDQLYLIVFDIFYADALDRPAENASETMIVRLTSATGIHGLAVPTSFVHRGYVRGITGIYFPNTDPDKPTWTDATLVAQIVGNPALSWESGQPVSNQVNPADNTASSMTVQQAHIVTFLRGQVPLLENNWFSATGTVTDLIAGQPAVLTATGEEYFLLASPDQRNLTPNLFLFNVNNPDIISYGRTTLSVAAAMGAGTATVREASRTGMVIGQQITIIGAAVWEVVRITNVVGNVVTFTPVLANAYPVNSQVWITAPSLQNTVNTQIAGSFLATMLTNGATAMGMSTIMFGTLLSLAGALAGGGGIGFVTGSVAGASGGASMLLGVVAAILFLVLFAFMGFFPLVGLGIVGTLLVIMAVYIVFFKY